MIKYLNIKNVCMSFILLGVVVLQACNGSEEVDLPENNVENSVFISAEIIQAPIDALLNSFFYTVSKSSSGFVLNNGGATEIAGSFIVKCVHPAADDIKVQFELDNSLITSAYDLLPDNAGFTVDKYELTIPKGETVSNDNITLSISSEGINSLPIPNYYDGVTYAYMSPVIKISSASNDVKIANSAQLTTASVAVKGSFANNLLASGAGVLPSGAEVTTKTGWTATVGGTAYPILLDGATGTAATAYVAITNASLPVSLEVDMQSVQTGITGIRLQHSARDYHASSANVYIKETASEEYKLQGPAFSLARPSNSSPYFHSIRFVNTVNARYIKLEFRTSYNTSNGVRPTEFSIYK
jgi:hypothetical protein